MTSCKASSCTRWTCAKALFSKKTASTSSRCKSTWHYATAPPAPQIRKARPVVSTYLPESLPIMVLNSTALNQIIRVHFMRNYHPDHLAFGSGKAHASFNFVFGEADQHQATPHYAGCTRK